MSNSGRMMVEDKQSTNGTKRNGRKIVRAGLSETDTVEIGDTRLRIALKNKPRQ